MIDIYRRITHTSTCLKFLLLTAVGLIYSDIVVVKFGSFHLTLPYICFSITITLILFGKLKLPKFSILLLLAYICSIEIVNALLYAYMTEVNWIKSFCLFMFFICGFLVIIGLDITHENIVKIGPWTLNLGIILGLIGIVQFFLLYLGIPAFLPEALSSKGFDPSISVIHRTGGLPTVNFVASEPSYFGIGLTILFAFILFLKNIKILKYSCRFIISIILINVAVLFSFSLSSIIMCMVLLLVYLIFNLGHIIKSARGSFFGICMLIFIMFIISNSSFNSIKKRFESFMLGSESSSTIRIDAAVRYLFSTETSIGILLMGTGLGMYDRDYVQYENIYSSVRPDRQFLVENIQTHNIFAQIKLIQGWNGLLIYCLILGTIIAPLRPGFINFVPMIVLLILINFAGGFFLSPSFWALLGLIYVVRKYQIKHIVRHRKRPNKRVCLLFLSRPIKLLRENYG